MSDVSSDDDSIVTDNDDNDASANNGDMIAEDDDIAEIPLLHNREQWSPDLYGMCPGSGWGHIATFPRLRADLRVLLTRLIRIVY
jgi:hypothetical protein